MPTRRISKDEDGYKIWKQSSCHDPEHDPPSMMVYEPGEWEHTCPSCGQVTKFFVPAKVY